MSARNFSTGVAGAFGMAVMLLSAGSMAADFSYKPPGTLKAGSGSGRADTRVYVPNMRFPIEKAPAFANSQVWGHGGMNGPSGGQCHTNNYSYPWWDDFCETRSWSVPLCPSGKGHQGQDIRPSTCEKNKHWAVAAEAGTITSIGTYTVTLKAANGVTTHRYMHMDNASLQVAKGARVEKGARLGRISNNMGSTPTTIHLHYDLQQNVSGIGTTFVPPYMSLVDSYQRLLGIPQAQCGRLPAQGGIIDNLNPCFELHGAPNSWRYVTSAGHGNDLHWTYGWDQARSNWAQWHLQFVEAGTYRVEVFTVAEYATSRSARYVVRHGGRETEKRLDYTAGSGWRSLGEFAFAAGADQWVTNNDNTGEPLSAQRKIIMDAVRVTRVEEAPVDPVDPTEPVEPGDEVDAGDGAEAGAGGGVPDVGAPDAGRGDRDVNDGPAPDAGSTVGPDVGAPDSGGAQEDGRAQQRSASTSSCASAGGQGAPLGWLGLVVGLGLIRWARRRARTVPGVA